MLVLAKQPLYSKLFAPTLLVITTQAFAVPAAQSAPISQITYPEVDDQLGEKLYPNEALYADKIATELEREIKHRDKSGIAQRDVHPKAHGCVKAEFQVNNQLPAMLSKGVFVAGKTYPAWIRFSNASSNPKQADTQKDARGMAIKLMDVPGKKLLDDEADASTQDFIMINHPVFFMNDPARYLALTKAANGNFFQKVKLPFLLGLQGTKNALGALGTISNPVQTRYWSMVPYQLGTGDGRIAVKYSARACTHQVDAIPKHADTNFLRGALKQTLQKGDACMEFLVQPRASSALSVEDSMTEWKESDAPFYKVATIRIPQQDFDTPEQNQMCENLSFNPWHALPEHRPLGSTNRMRKVIYDHISQVRHDLNQASRQEP